MSKTYLCALALCTLPAIASAQGPDSPVRMVFNDGVNTYIQARPGAVLAVPDAVRRQDAFMVRGMPVEITVYARGRRYDVRRIGNSTQAYAVDLAPERAPLNPALQVEMSPPPASALPTRSASSAVPRVDDAAAVQPTQVESALSIIGAEPAQASTKATTTRPAPPMQVDRPETDSRGIAQVPVTAEAAPPQLRPDPDIRLEVTGASEAEIRAAIAQAKANGWTSFSASGEPDFVARVQALWPDVPAALVVNGN
ncbi:hypothetical protein BKK79_36720 (plasmid) [Cupriavidus sp. USMAA2-4]|uniref:hypothetical protein n=1 Tax=Cupriavidus sp. USMAA2-4 TaxID=876364 RepID=UPI0008A6E650|nr:hypothetical protein [Cupriavidus sp. USMAA2-4]AOY97494.1 hypothetical protein BKK79_36720 [Cupriavidus sp. USMAA2-4]